MKGGKKLEDFAIGGASRASADCQETEPPINLAE